MFSTFPSLRLPRRLLALYGGIKRLPVNSSEAFLSLYFSYCNLSPCTVDLDDRETTMHMLVPNHRHYDKPNLVLVHGYGGNSKWQFVLQVAQLSRDFNIYIPDLVFFGKSYSTSSERTDTFQAKCVCDGMKKLGVEKGFIAADGYKKEKQELVEYLLMEKPHLQFPVLTQETLIIWGEKDNIFPVDLAHELHRHLGPKSKLEILKDVGHAANMEAPYSLNKLVTMFVSSGNC
nr:alpha/beta hydrolase fold-1 [Tanacetum cinerariifolium]